VVCIIKNTATLAGSLFTLHCSQIHIDLPTLSDEDKDVSSNSRKCDFMYHCVTVALSLMYPLPFRISPLTTRKFWVRNIFAESSIPVLRPTLILTCMNCFQVIKKWGAPNKIDFLSLSYTRHAEDVRQVSNY